MTVQQEGRVWFRITKFHYRRREVSGDSHFTWSTTSYCRGKNSFLAYQEHTEARQTVSIDMNLGYLVHHT